MRWSCWLLLVCLGLGCDVLGSKEDFGLRKDVVERINDARGKTQQCGTQTFDPAPPLRWNAVLAAASLRHSEDMAANGNAGHVGTDGSGPERRIREAGYRYAIYGEVVATGYKTGKDAVQGLFDSPGHCAVMMNPNYTEAGAAMAGGHFWTVDFGTPRSVSTP